MVRNAARQEKSVDRREAYLTELRSQKEGEADSERVAVFPNVSE